MGAKMGTTLNKTEMAKQGIGISYEDVQWRIFKFLSFWWLYSLKYYFRKAYKVKDFPFIVQGKTLMWKVSMSNIKTLSNWMAKSPYQFGFLCSRLEPQITVYAHWVKPYVYHRLCFHIRIISSKLVFFLTKEFCFLYLLKTYFIYTKNCIKHS